MQIEASVGFPTETELEDDASVDTVRRIADLYEDLEARDLQPLWTQNERLMGPVPAPSAVSWVWRKKMMWEMAERAAELITITRGGDRRVLALANPGLGGAPFATPTLWAAIQYLNPFEEAPGHRHTPSAVRFVMEGEGTWTTVDGDAIDMRPGDLVLTPPWCWHDHKNDAAGRMVWFDGLDMPLVKYLDAIFFEPYPVEELQPVVGRNISERRYRGRGSVPLGGNEPDPTYSPLRVYRYEDTDATLDALLDEDGQAMASLEFVNPVNGRPALPTMGCEMHRLVPGRRTPTEQKVGSSVFVVFRGAGSSVIDSQRFGWEAGDILAVPSWAAVDHEATEESDLFSITDTPVIRALGLQRQTTHDVNQVVTTSFRGQP